MMNESLYSKYQIDPTSIITIVVINNNMFFFFLSFSLLFPSLFCPFDSGGKMLIV